MEEQVCVIYAGVNGYLDPMPVDRVRAFEDGLLHVLRAQHADILNGIRDSRDLNDELAGKLKAVVEGFAKTFACSWASSSPPIHSSSLPPPAGRSVTRLP